MSLNSLKLRTKIGLIVALMAIPIGLFVWMYIQQSQKDALAAQQELSGVEYEQAVWKAMTSVAMAKGNAGATPASQVANLPDLGALSTKYDAAFGSGDKMKAFKDQLQTIGWPAKAIDASVDVTPILDAGNDLIGAVSDGAGLSIDPQIDTYYIITALTVNQPSVLRYSNLIRSSETDLQQSKTYPIDKKHGIAINIAMYKKAVDDTSSSYDTAISLGKDFAIKSSITPKTKQLNADASKFADDASDLSSKFDSDTPNDKIDPSAMYKTRASADVANNDLWLTSAKELTRLLNGRIDGINSGMYTMLAIGLAVLVVAVGTALLISMQTARSFSRIIGTMDRIRQNDYSVVVEGTKRKDEIGEIARAVEVFKATGLEVAELTANYRGQVEAIRKFQAVIEFDLNGRIIDANDVFATTMGYGREEIIGKHHRVLVEHAHRESEEYRQFWERLGRGEYQHGTISRLTKAGKTVWLRATYNPIIGLDGKPFKVVKFAMDCSAEVEATTLLQTAVKQTQDVVAAAKNNNLTQRIPMEGKTGDIGELCAGVNGLIDTMATVITDINSVTATISAAVGEITSGTNDLSERTEKQASSLQQTSSSMEEMSTTIKQNADNAQQANQLAINARTVATEGGQVVAKAVDAMSKIESSSRKISDIIGVIDEIAFQTNLLALNAAVEAARAGDAGRGFAVVASEVRSLAQRSSEAAKDIKGLIVQSGAQVKDGVTLVNNAGASLQEIVDSVKRVTDIVSEIAAASKEQSIGVEEINRAVGQMDEMTQQNSALVEENAASCRMLQQQAENMQQRMSIFEIEPGHRSAASHTATPTLLKQAANEPAKITQQPKAARQPVKRQVAVKGAQRMQADLAAAFETDNDWKEF